MPLASPDMYEGANALAKAAAAPAGGTSSVPSSTPPSSSTSNNAPKPGVPPPAGQYDLNTDPVLNQVQASVAAANSQAQAQALAQQKQALLAYGDPSLAKAMLGAKDPTYLAILGGDPESQLGQLGRQYGQERRQFETTIDPSLVDSGYRAEQEGNMAQAYQDALAQAASGIQSQLQGIQGDLGSEEAQQAQAESQAISYAYNRALTQQLALASASGTSGSSLANLLSALGG